MSKNIIKFINNNKNKLNNEIVLIFKFNRNARTQIHYTIQRNIVKLTASQIQRDWLLICAKFH